MMPDEREALVERMAAKVEVEVRFMGYPIPGRVARCIARAALAVAEPVVREDEREACINAARKALTAYGRWDAAITPETLMAKIEPAIQASAVEVADE